ncbi:long-chain fatty acid--CoA ligase [Natronosporangium hydrolyticum]|uniref:Long-chain fatty acid--CoA ligase n=1 Tax=Natronosporangium hydrolyticum TaxID=2811111 RepID=A0A895YMB7_9ACTN|nr:long-chain fatty acid--CoA ligase [Natronosporangium hydrolyticum]QSB16619.1 long-chain fatty acid--CoA ligase [Natronosporangium hydrolyticum]
MADQGVGSWPRRRARIAPGDTALIYQGEPRSFGELAQRVDRLRQRLAELEVAPGDRVAYLGPNQPAFVEAMFATMAAGAVFVPLNTRLAAPELAHLLRDAQVRAFIWAESHEQTAQAVLEAAPVELRVVAGAGSEAAGYTLEQLVEQGQSGTPEVPVATDDLAMIMYTSGTTGQPRGATLTHANLTWNVFNVLIDVDVSQREVTLVSAPLFHTAALNQTFLPTFIKGGAAVLEAAFDPQRSLHLIAEHRITWMFGVPAMFQALAAAPGWDTADLSSIRAVEAGGAPVPEELIRTYQARGLTFMQGYGMTEASPGVLFLRAGDSLRKVGSAGTPCFFTEVDLIDDAGATTPAGEPGEVVVRGPNVMVGYWRNEAATAAVLDQDGWFRSGDVAVRDDEGHLRIVDRKKDMFISGGENVYPAEVENAIYDHPAVRECAVIGVPDTQWGEVGRAYIVLNDGHQLDHPELAQFLTGRLARYKIPQSLVLLAELPRTASGKLQKQRLRSAGG